MSMNSNPEKGKQPKNIKQKVAQIGGAAALVAAVSAGSIAGYNAVDGRANQGPSAESMAQIAQAEVIAYQSVVLQAQEYTNALNEGIANHDPKPIPMQVLNGEIRIESSPVFDVKATIAKGGTAPSYKNPIILSTIDNNFQPDAKGNFLVGSWLGIQENDANGKIVIAAVPYDAKSDKFVAYDPKEIIFPNMGVYATGMEDHGNSAMGPNRYVLQGFDITGSRVIGNPDGTPVTPGLPVGMK